MHPKSTQRLVLERLPSGEMAWLRPEEPAEDDEALYTITEKGRRALAVARFLDRGPTVAEVFGLTPTRIA